MTTAFNPFKPYGNFHRYQLEQSIFVLRDVRWIFFILIHVLIENYESKKRRPWPEATFYGDWSGSVLFSYMYVPQRGR